MARPIKGGLDYFTLDTDIDSDSKVEFLEAKHGLQGFAIFIKLLARTYRSGYYLQWGEREALILSRRVNVDINSICDIVNDCLNDDLFDVTQYNKHQILTSKGIQKRFLAGAIRRKDVSVYKEYLLLTLIEVKNIHPNVVIVDINSPQDVINVDINYVQDELIHTKVHKGKERKGKEIKVKIKDTQAISQKVDVEFIETALQGEIEDVDILGHLYEEFKERFWAVYPSRDGKKIGKDPTFKEFLKVKEYDRESVYLAINNFANSKMVKDGIGIMDPIRFFKSRDYPNGIWREWLSPDNPPSPTKTQGAAMSVRSILEKRVTGGRYEGAR